MSIEAMKQALEALEWNCKGEPLPTLELKAITALRQAIEQAEKQEKLCKYCGGIGRVVCDGRCMPEQEPVAWMYVNEDGECEQIEYGTDGCDDPDVQPLYTAPPPKREWVGLTDKEIFDTLDSYDEEVNARQIEALLKKKNT